MLVRPPSDDAQLSEVFNRLEAELHIHGFDTELQDPAPDPPTRDALREMAETTGAVAAFALSRRETAASLEVLLFDRSGEPAARSLPIERRNDAANLVAVRAVDMLRASLLDFPEAEAPPPEPSVAPPESSEPQPFAASPAVDRRFSIAVEGTLLWPGESFGVALGPALGFFHHATAWLRWGVWLAAPLLGASLETASGDATVRQELGLVEARLTLLRAGNLSIGPLAGGGVFLLQASGRVEAPLRPASDSVWSGLVVLGAHATQGIGDRFELSLSARALGLVPGLGVAVATDEAELSLPAVQAAIGLGVRF